MASITGKPIITRFYSKQFMTDYDMYTPYNRHIYIKLFVFILIILFYNGFDTNHVIFCPFSMISQKMEKMELLHYPLQHHEFRIIPTKFEAFWS